MSGAYLALTITKKPLKVIEIRFNAIATKRFCNADYQRLLETGKTASPSWVLQPNPAPAQMKTQAELQSALETAKTNNRVWTKQLLSFV